MLKPFLHLISPDRTAFWRYAAMAAGYGLLSGVVIVAQVPIFIWLFLGDMQRAALWLLAMIAGCIACWACRRAVDKAGVGVGLAVLGEARQRIGDHVARLPIGWFTPENTARLSHVITHGMTEVAQLPAHVFTPVLSGAVTPVVVVGALTALDWRMGLIALVALPLATVMFLLAGCLGRDADRAFHARASETGQRAVEFAQAQSVLRAFNGNGDATRFLEQAIDRQARSAYRLILRSVASVVLNSWMVQAVFAALLVAAAFWLHDDLMAGVDARSTVAVILSLLMAARFIEPLLDVAGYGEALRAARGHLEAVEAILAVTPLPEPVSPELPVDASVELCDVAFRYAPDQPAVIDGVSLRIEPGQMVALVGASGSGKTTIMKLVSRFFDVEHGSVRIGGVDVRNMSSEALAGQISQIFQDSYLFRGSIADNIRIGCPKAQDDAVRDFAGKAGIAEMIARLPDGLDTPVGEGGVRLSGGERQRIAIARALIKDAPILLIDEATAALDAENQAAIASTLTRLRGRRTLIVIAHQLSTIAQADRIVVLDEGRIAQHGTHAELVNEPGLYADFLARRKAAKGWTFHARHSG
ncbi:ABC transporter ATP-binding protein [Novosphingobium resinovorum]|uniref:ABC transporter ATP-binding protein n=1 Tax=Novosphingobium resinovorum TaxID=158500 RepID=A0A1D8ACM4_9SPHN|nr:ABC transporter ATP-binding protein [Novosphingobium resinovorum]AOR79884.1 ABC transporter ATP-binding protein [Novosphingobium resinovorum]